VIFTVFGASGFIGKRIVAELRSSGIDCVTPARSDDSVFSRELGHVIYSVGYTADFREQLTETVEAHVCRLNELLARGHFHSLLYLSSTRIYARAQSTAEELPIAVAPSDPGDLYNISKMMGESSCLARPNRTVRVVRLSNVFGPGSSASDFLPSIVRDAVKDHHVVLRTSLASSKDYVSVDAVANVLPKIAMHGRHRIYNVAAGFNVTHAEILHRLQELTGCGVESDEAAERAAFPIIDVTRLRSEFAFNSQSVLEALGELVTAAR
jgi:nucleoside-diphosphate-sugar epimerase